MIKGAGVVLAFAGLLSAATGGEAAPTVAAVPTLSDLVLLLLATLILALTARIWRKG